MRNEAFDLILSKKELSVFNYKVVHDSILELKCIHPEIVCLFLLLFVSQHQIILSQNIHLGPYAMTRQNRRKPSQSHPHILII